MLFVLLVIEVIVTFFSFSNNWPEQVSLALLFADVLTLFNELMCIINKFDNEHREMQNQIQKEHNQIKGAIDLYSDIEELEYISCFEGNYVQEQNASGVEIWIISNSIDEPAEVLEKIFENLIKGVQYYYIIPNDQTSENDLKNTVSKLSEILKKSRKKISGLHINYIQDELFDFLPINIVDILYYCNPKSTDHNNMRIFYSFQNNTQKGIFYKPVDLDNIKTKAIFNKMIVWKNQQWNKLNLNL